MKVERLCPVISLIVASPVLAQEPQVTFASSEVVPGIYILQGQGGFAGGNLGLLTGDDGSVLIDDGLEPLSDMTLAAVRDVTDRPVDFVINTHLHGDHVGGNEAFFEAGATIIGHDNVRRRLTGESPDSGDDGPPSAASLPQITFDRSMTLHLNGHEAFVFHVASAHTDGDAVIFFRKEDVIHAGDVMFNGMFPFIDLDSGGSLEGYLAAQEDLLSLAGPETRIIPGHGPLASKADLEAAHDMLADARDRIRKLVDDGKTLDEIMTANPLASYHDKWNWEFITTERMTQTIHRALTQN
jgi:glyoxylase-like metal-dependent hydrolase (beta-lactamase superfamily II)